jgi:type I restriction enzyme S subunit
VTHLISQDWLNQLDSQWPGLALGYRYDVQLGKMLDEKRITGDHLRPYLRNVDVQWGRINRDNLPTMDFGLDEREKFSLRAGDILVCEGGEVGRAAMWNEPDESEIYFQKALHRLRPLDGRSECTRYLYYALQAAAELGAYGTGEKATIAHLPGDAFRRVRFPKPPYNAQERIANFLDEQTTRIDALIAEKGRLVDSLREYQYSQSSRLMTRGLNENASMSKTSFPEIAEVPAQWSVKRLKLLGDVRSGVAKGKDLGNRDTVKLPYLRVANVQDGYVDLTEVSEIEVPETEASRYLLRRGDVLMNEGGDNDKLGRGAVWQGQIEPCIHQNHVFAVRLDDPSLAEWVSQFTSTDAARAYFFLRSKQSTNLASINQSNVRELPVPMPPAEERALILAELQRVTQATFGLLDHALEHIDRLREYRSSLISAAVTGQMEIDSFKVAA